MLASETVIQEDTSVRQKLIRRSCQVDIVNNINNINDIVKEENSKLEFTITHLSSFKCQVSPTLVSTNTSFDTATEILS